jgi:guanylate cyclase
MPSKKNKSNSLFAYLQKKLQRQAERLIAHIAKLGSAASDDEQTRLNKTLITGAAILFIPAGLVWSWGYFHLGLSLAGFVPLAASLLLLMGLIYYIKTKRYDSFRTFALTQTLLMPIVLTIILGGFVNSGLVILWSALAPFAAMILENQKRAMGWFLSFLVVIPLLGSIQNWIPIQHTLPEPFIRISFIMNLGSAFIITFITASYFVVQKEMYKARSETLLLNILPRKIAEKLKKKSSHIAEHYPEASVLFADIAGFTPLAASLQAGEVVDMLNEIFVAFDNILRKHQLEKIKTIGDCYMAAAGVPAPREDHAQALALAALEMLDYAHSHSFHGRRLQFRIGIDSGPLVAGVIGKDKFIYDLWGDTVNLASRMESHGLPGKIQITRAVYDQINENIICRKRGLVSVKGKGRLETFWVLRQK